MELKKIRFLEPGNRPYRPSIRNLYVYDRYIRTPSIGLLTLATIVQPAVPDTRMYSESISKIRWDDVLDADLVCIGVFTFSAPRGYALADYVRAHSKAVVVLGGLHASLNPGEACAHADYVLLGEGDASILELVAALRAGRTPDFPGLAWQGPDGMCTTGPRRPPTHIDTIPNRDLLYRYREMAGHNTIWPQVHASRGCPHACDYCAVVCHFGHQVRTRTPENVVADIRYSIDFHDKGRHRLAKMLWLTDDNFFADRDWAMAVLRAIIDSGISYQFTVQARYEVGYDDEMLDLLRRAGFTELALGIEFLEDEAFAHYHKKSTYAAVCGAVDNIQRHGLRARGLFILGADNHTKGVGDRLADFVIAHDISGVLIQSMYFIPGTPVYDSHKQQLLHTDWAKYNGNVVHRPAQISPYDLQKELIRASARIYSVPRLVQAVWRKRGMERLLFIGEFFWQKSVRADWKRELKYLKDV